MRYVSKPTEVEAVQWTDSIESADACRAFAGDKVQLTIWNDDENPYLLELLAGVDGAQGWVPVPAGHYLVSNVGDRSDIWPVDATYFEQKYAAASSEPV